MQNINITGFKDPYKKKKRFICYLRLQIAEKSSVTQVI